MSKNIFINFCKISLIFTLISITAFSQKLQFVSSSMPASPYPINYVQPDGSNITINLKGDEYLNWAKTIDGYTLVKNNQNGFEYAKLDATGNLVSSGILANNPDKRTNKEIIFLKSIQQNLKYSKDQIIIAKSKKNKSSKGTNSFPSTGTTKLLLILVNFNNTTTTYTQTNFTNYMNQVGYNYQGATGSFRDYYLDNSFNQLDVTTTVTAWVTVSNTHDYYGPSSKWTQLAKDAVVAAHTANPSLDFSQFDNDGDGSVDGIAIFHQGPGQEASGNSNDVWSHSGDISSSYSLSYNGVTIGSYTMQPEVTGSYMTAIGVMCHEFGHNLGLPDLYDTDYSSDGIGEWDMMAGGSWLNSGQTPSNHCCWSKYALGWITPTTISTANNYTLKDASTYQDCFRINITGTGSGTGFWNEYFLLENRQKIGWDAYLPGHGMIVYHIDGTKLYNGDYSNNTPNDDPTHQDVDIEEADGTLTTANSGDGGDPFPGTSSKTAFTDATTPNSKSWANANAGKPITNIAENTSTHVITFGLLGGAPGAVTADFYANSTTIYSGGAATFTSTSITPTGTTITNYQWTFTGGTPSTYVGQTPPAITYSTAGTYAVSLTITNSSGASDTETKNSYITVNPAPTCNWITQASAFTTASRGVYYISIVDPNTVWAVALDGQTYTVVNEYTRTTNGGTNWKYGTMPGVTSGDITASIAGVSSTKAYIAAYNSTTPASGGIFVTTNGGTSWTKQTTAAFNSTSFPNVVHFFNSTDGFCMGDPNGGYFEIYTTTNGGTNWVRTAQANISANQTGEYGYTNMVDAVGNTAWFGTNKGRLFKTTDKGLHWTAYSITGFTDLSHFSFNDANNGLAQQITYNTSTGAITTVKMRVTHDGGATWTTVTPPGLGIYYSSIDGVPGVAGKYISVGKDTSGNWGSSYSTNYGATWTNIDLGTQYISTKFYDVNTGWAGGYNTNSTTGGIYKYNSLTTTVEEISNNNEEFFVYPNPSSGIVNIQLYGVQKQNLKIKIYNLLGDLVYEKNDYSYSNNHFLALDLSSFNKGIYFAVIECNNQIAKKKIILE